MGQFAPANAAHLAPRFATSRLRRPFPRVRPRTPLACWPQAWHEGGGSSPHGEGFAEPAGHRGPRMVVALLLNCFWTSIQPPFPFLPRRATAGRLRTAARAGRVRLPLPIPGRPGQFMHGEHEKAGLCKHGRRAGRLIRGRSPRSLRLVRRLWAKGVDACMPGPRRPHAAPRPHSGGDVPPGGGRTMLGACRADLPRRT